MKPASLSTKIFTATGLILVALCLASFVILYHAQTQQAEQEMDVLLENQVFALSALVSARQNGKFDFEISPFFLSQYKGLKPSGFFRFIDPQNGQVLQESSGAPSVGCSYEIQNNTNITFDNDHHFFRIKNLIFRPEIDPDLKNKIVFQPSNLCLIVGIDSAPYKSLVIKTLLATIPILITLVVFLIGILLIFVRSMTRDLSRLTLALATADFSATHEFPILPDAQTLEVKTVVEKLAGLHSQAANVYREMWLFLGRAAHQLKTPVAAIQATLQVLLRKDRTKEELLSGLQDVETAVSQLSSLTKKLITSSRISYQEPSPHQELIDIRTFILEQVKLFSSQAKQYEVLLQVISTDPFQVLTNPFLLSEIFGNLIENAILYSPRGTHAEVTISWERTQKSIEIFISDQGPGFSEQVKQALFKPFARGDERQVAGSGLGLSIAKKSAQIIGADIMIKETSPKGSKIVIILPILNFK